MKKLILTLVAFSGLFLVQDIAAQSVKNIQNGVLVKTVEMPSKIKKAIKPVTTNLVNDKPLKEKKMDATQLKWEKLKQNDPIQYHILWEARIAAKRKYAPKRSN